MRVFVKRNETMHDQVCHPCIAGTKRAERKGRGQHSLPQSAGSTRVVEKLRRSAGLAVRLRPKTAAAEDSYCRSTGARTADGEEKTRVAAR